MQNRAGDLLSLEISCLKDIKHDGVVKLLGSGTKGYVTKPSGKRVDNLSFLILEFASFGTLFDHCKKNGPLEEVIAKYFFYQLVSILEYLHNDLGLVHRDLKLENILLTSDFSVKLTDFGFSKKVRGIFGSTLLKSQRGTVAYMAPEVKYSNGYNGQKCDIFSLGVILFVMVVGIFPFQEATTTDSFYKILYEGNYEKYWKDIGGQKLSN